MSKTAAVLAGVGRMTAVGLGGGLLVYNQLSQPKNSNTNSNVVATNSNTNATKSTKSALLGTWVQTFKTDDPDNPKNKVEFTADEIITSEEVITYTDKEKPEKKKNTKTKKGKYKIFCGQFIEAKADESDAVDITKFMLEGDDLTVFGSIKEEDRKYKRESSNTAANTSDSKTEEVTLNGKDLVGTWNDTEKPENKHVFTEDQMTIYYGDMQLYEGKYKLPCGQILEFTDERGIHFSKAMIEGSEMTLDHHNGQKYKLRREGDNAANETADENLTEEVKIFKHKLTATWKNSSEKVIFTSDGKFLLYDNYGNLTGYYSYRFIDDQTVEWNTLKFEKVTAKMTFKDDNKTLVWEAYWGTFNYTLESENADVNLGDSLADNVKGNWVGIAGTNSADERISIGLSSWNTPQNNEVWSDPDYTVGNDGTVKVGIVTYKVTVADDVMTTELDGVVKKYNRLKTVVDE